MCKDDHIQVDPKADRIEREQLSEIKLRYQEIQKDTDLITKMKQDLELS